MSVIESSMASSHPDPHFHLPIRIALKTRLWHKRARDTAEARDPWKQAYRSAKSTVHRLLEEPFSGWDAWFAVFFIVLVIVVSVTCFILETLPELETPYWVLFFGRIQLCCIVVFTVEFFLRVWSAKGTWKDVLCNPLTIIDALSIIPFYITLLLNTLEVWNGEADGRFLRLYRLLVMIKFTRYSRQITLFGEGSMNSRMFFVIFSSMVCTGTLLASVLMWVLERGQWDEKKGCYARVNEPFWSGCSPFESIPMGCWWAVTTLTTVGYGDAFAITPWGRLINAFVMLGGLACVAVPTCILSIEFATMYKKKLREVNECDTHKQLRSRPKEDLIFYAKVIEVDVLKVKLTKELKRAYHLCLALSEEGSLEDGDEALRPLDLLCEQVQIMLERARKIAMTVAPKGLHVPHCCEEHFDV